MTLFAGSHVRSRAISRNRWPWLVSCVFLALFVSEPASVLAYSLNNHEAVPEEQGSTTRSPRSFYVYAVRPAARQALAVADHIHGDVSSNMVNYVGWLDRFFAGKDYKEESRGSYAQVGVGAKWKENEGAGLDTDIHLRVRLPRLENRLQLVLDDLSDRFDVEDRKLRDPVLDLETPERQAGLRYMLIEKRRYRMNVDAGINTSPVDPFLKLRGSLKIPCGDADLMQLRQTVKYAFDAGFKETTSIEWNKQLDSRWIFRTSTSLTWEEITNGVAPQQVFELIGQLDSRQALKFQLSGYWPNTPHTLEANYWINCTYRRRIYSDWLFTEITPQVEFPQDENYDAVPSIKVMLSALFGDWLDSR